jgi:hypothetical protein
VSAFAPTTISHLSDNVKAFVENSVGHVSRNTYFGVDGVNWLALNIVPAACGQFNSISTPGERLGSSLGPNHATLDPPAPPNFQELNLGDENSRQLTFRSLPLKADH